MTPPGGHAMTGQENAITAGFQLTSVACPGCGALVPVEGSDLAGLPGSGLGDIVAVAQELAHSGCPAYPGNPPHEPVYLLAGPALPRYEFSISTWTPEQMEVFKAKLDALMRSDVARRLAVRLLPPAKSLDDKAAALAAKNGSFSLHFDATQNPASPDYRPWTVILDGSEDQGWGGFTADEAIAFAAAELGRSSEDWASKIAADMGIPADQSMTPDQAAEFRARAAELGH
jgi:hypothetical protein